MPVTSIHLGLTKADKANYTAPMGRKKLSVSPGLNLLTS